MISSSCELILKWSSTYFCWLSLCWYCYPSVNQNHSMVYMSSLDTSHLSNMSSSTWSSDSTRGECLTRPWVMRRRGWVWQRRMMSPSWSLRDLSWIILLRVTRSGLVEAAEMEHTWWCLEPGDRTTSSRAWCLFIFPELDCCDTSTTLRPGWDRLMRTGRGGVGAGCHWCRRYRWRSGN